METRKRPLEEQSDRREKKRFNNDDRLPLLKLLVPTYAAGALIGKGGSIHTELENQFDCTIRLSQNKEYYPGTDERIVAITGKKDRLVVFNNLIMEKVQTEQCPRDDKRGDSIREQQVKIVLTNDAAGLLIGLGGQTIKAIQEKSKAKISVAGRGDAPVPGERILTISGDMEQRIEACSEVIDKISNEQTNVANVNLKYSHISMLGITGALTNVGTMLSDKENVRSIIEGLGVLPEQSCKLKTTATIEMEIPDILVGSILGKHGQIVNEFVQFSGAKMQFSGKNEFAPGTTDRILTITGDIKQAQTAYFLVSQKVELAESELSSSVI